MLLIVLRIIEEHAIFIDHSINIRIWIWDEVKFRERDLIAEFLNDYTLLQFRNENLKHGSFYGRENVYNLVLIFILL